MNLESVQLQVQAWLAGTYPRFTEELDRFHEGADNALAPLIYRAPAGDRTKSYQRMETFAMQARARRWTGPDAFARTDTTLQTAFREYFPGGWVFGPYPVNKFRVPLEPRSPGAGGLPSFQEGVEEQAAATIAEISPTISDDITRALISSNNGFGAFTGDKTVNDGLPFFDASRVTFRNNSASGNVLELSSGVNNWTNPNLAAARHILERAEDHFLAVDAWRGTFQSRDKFRAETNLHVLSTSAGWDLAFRNLADAETLAEDTTDPATNQAFRTNPWRGRFRHIHTTSEYGTGHEQYVRVFALGSRPDQRPLRWSDDIPLTPFVFDYRMEIDYGWFMSYYLDPYDHLTGVLLKEA
jgi:hypothetical protein